MSEQATETVQQEPQQNTQQNQPQAPEQLSDVLLVMDKEKKTIQAVTGIDENGNLKTVDANKKNQNEFMRVDKSGDIFSNFFSNFWRQLKDPTRFAFFKVPAKDAVETAEKMQQQVNAPTKEGEAVMAKHEVKEPKEQQQENKKDMETTQTAQTAQPTQTAQATPEKSEYRFKADDIDWKTLEQLGVKRETLERTGAMEGLLKGYKTNFVVPVSVNLGTVVLRSEARLGLQFGENGKTVFMMYGVRHEPDLKNSFFGHEFTKEDRDNLLKTGNMGRVVDLTYPKTGEKVPSIISIDKLTNEVIALRQDWIKVPEQIGGVKLNEQQKKDLYEGKQIYLEGMVSKSGKTFDSDVQYNADKRYPEYLFDRGEHYKQAQNQRQGQQQENPRIFRGKEFNDEQHKKLSEGKTIYVTDFKDGKGQPYKGYVKMNPETKMYDFSFRNPDKLKDKIVPAEAHKTQVAVNSEGKTNEATKNINEPLKPQQTAPINKQQQEKQEAPKPAKSKGIKR
ncbi:MAG: DUF3945 domain-containing protein [Agriterribacter sp.]